MADRGDQGKNPRTGQGAVHTLHGHTPSSPRPLGTPHQRTPDSTENATIQLKPDTPKHDPAEILPRRFEVLGQLGEGGAGVVVAARDTVLRRDVAIKVLHKHRDALEEARAAAELHHESIVTVFDVDPGGRYIVMELVDGETLQQKLERGKLPVAEVYALGRALCGALGAAHARGIVHRDVKPANILFDKQGAIKLNDFGVARRTSSGEVNEIAGTPAYMAPEVWDGAEPDAKTDVFGVGVTLWEAAVGKPARAQRRANDGKAVLDTEAVLEATGDARLAAAIKRAIATKPAERCTIAELAAALAPHVASRRGVMIGAGLASAAAIGVAVFSLSSGGKPEPAPVTDTTKTVATVPFVDRTTKLPGARLELASLLASELRHVPNVAVVASDQLLERSGCGLGQDADAWRTCAATMHADAVVSGTLSAEGDRIAVELVVSRIDGTRLGRITAHATSGGVSALVRRHAGQIAELVAGTKTGDLTIDPDLDLGIEALHQQEYQEAKRLFDAVLARDPQQTDALYYRAICLYWESAPLPDVDAAFDRALAAKLSPMQDGIVRGFRMLEHREVANSLAHWKRMVEEYPTNTVVQYGMVEAQFHGGYPSDAIVRYRELAEADRDFRLALMHPFDYYIVRGDREGASWALSRTQRFGIKNLTEWSLRMRVMAGDLDGAISALLAEQAEADRKKLPSPFPSGLLALGMTKADPELIKRGAPLDHTAQGEFALELFRGDVAGLRKSFDHAVASSKARGRRGTYDLSRMVPILSQSSDPTIWKDALAVIEDTAKSDPNLSINEMLATVFLAGRLGNKEMLGSYAKSPVPEVARTATAWLSNLDGKPARDEWRQAFALSADGLFVVAGKAQLARQLDALGDRAGVAEICGELFQPRVVDLSIGPVIPRCLAWTGDKRAAALGRLR